MTADLIVTNGKVVTLDREDRIVQALAVRGEAIAALGRDDDIEALAGPGTKRIDAAGRAVVPGLIDGHAHMDREGLKERLPSLAGCGSIADICARIAALARATPKGEWIVTMPIGVPPFYEDVPGLLAENRWPTRHDLDAVAPDHPVYIRAIWGHWRNTLPLVSIANSRALDAAGIGRATMPPAPSIQIDRDHATGEPTGILYEFTFKPLVEKTLMACIPQFGREDRVEGLRRSMAVYNAFGTTSVFEGHGIAAEVLAAYQALRAEGPPAVRAHLMASPAWPSADPADIRRLLADWGRHLAGRGLGDAYLRFAGLYTESEYSEENRLRALQGPYTGWAGFNFNAALPKEVMVEMLVECARLGIRAGSFDADILDVYESVDKQVGIGGKRWLIEHIGMFDVDEIARIRDLGLVCQAYSNRWIWQEGEVFRAEHGEAAGSCVLPMRDLIDAGIHVSLATDNVPPSLFHSIHHVTARLPRYGDRPLGPDQAIGRAEALAAASREGAWLSFEEDFKGTLEVGKAADLAILDADPLTCAEDALPEIAAAVTVVGGRVTRE